MIDFFLAGLASLMFGSKAVASPCVAPRPTTLVTVLHVGHLTSSWYGDKEVEELPRSRHFHPYKDFVAASLSMPFGTRLILTNPQEPTRFVVVTVLDRGPYVSGRDLDVSRAAASVLGIMNRGVVDLKVERLRSGY
jgi:rare lipoprotein A